MSCQRWIHAWSAWQSHGSVGNNAFKDLPSAVAVSQRTRLARNSGNVGAWQVHVLVEEVQLAARRNVLKPQVMGAMQDLGPLICQPRAAFEAIQSEGYGSPPAHLLPLSATVGACAEVHLCLVHL